jgi:hypothetical protein
VAGRESALPEYVDWETFRAGTFAESEEAAPEHVEATASLVDAMMQG